jgi:hypothetical protein
MVNNLDHKMIKNIIKINLFILNNHKHIHLNLLKVKIITKYQNKNNRIIIIIYLHYLYPNN